MQPFEMPLFICLRCGHRWPPRGHAQKGRKVEAWLEIVEVGMPTVCPKCKSPYWKQPRQQKEPIKFEKEEE